ncbi:hypothetical protein UF78_00205 [Stutzerimonas stutzeri]|uniref:Uncharacterized protein n=1 Tax=Stutzerimonas stutzeri TaxID=316 RepID=A0A0D9AW34_STUST|nr:hypothetical protein UF78_00205 [Stutzerimonas stutzeri]
MESGIAWFIALVLVAYPLLAPWRKIFIAAWLVIWFTLWAVLFAYLNNELNHVEEGIISGSVVIGAAILVYSTGSVVRLLFRVAIRHFKTIKAIRNPMVHNDNLA